MSPIMCQWKDLHEPHTCWDQLSCTCAHQLPHMPHCCLGWSSSTYDGTRKGPHWYQLSCTQSCLLPPVPHSHQDPHDLGCCCLCNTSSLDWIWTPWVGLGNRPLCVVHTQRWNWSYSWTSGSVKLGKKSWNLSSPLNKLQSDASTNGFVNSTHIEHLSEQMFPNAKKGYYWYHLYVESKTTTTTSNKSQIHRKRMKWGLPRAKRKGKQNDINQKV